MASPDAAIHRLESPKDANFMRFYVGKANMESRAIANRQVYAHPITLAIWIAVSCAFIEYMNWWPAAEFGVWGYLRPLPAFGCMLVPLMALVDWRNRELFEPRTDTILRRPDLVDILKYYARSPSSGVWLLDYKNEIIGIIALDASLSSTSDESIPTEPVPGPDAKKTKADVRHMLDYKSGTSTIATIRHFFVREEYRGTGVQDDLLQVAVNHAFAATKTVKHVRATEESLKPYIGVALRGVGFRSVGVSTKFGMLNWRQGVCVLDRATWEKAKA